MSNNPAVPGDFDGDGIPDLGWDIARDGRMVDYATDDHVTDDLIVDPEDDDEESD